MCVKLGDEVIRVLLISSNDTIAHSFTMIIEKSKSVILDRVDLDCKEGKITSDIIVLDCSDSTKIVTHMKKVFDLKCASNIPILLILKPDSVKEKLIYFNLEVDGFISYPFNEKEIIEELKHSGKN